MNELEKRRPQPLGDDGELESALSAAAAGDIEADLSISFRVSGGAPGQRYRLELEIRGQRLEVCRLDCAISDRHRAVEGRQMAVEDYSSLARHLLHSGLLDTKVGPPRFLPDTVVAVITVASGSATRRFYFAADADQAAVQGLTAPTAVLNAAEALYHVAGSMLDMDDVRP